MKNTVGRPIVSAMAIVIPLLELVLIMYHKDLKHSVELDSRVLPSLPIMMDSHCECFDCPSQESSMLHSCSVAAHST